VVARLPPGPFASVFVTHEIEGAMLQLRPQPDRESVYLLPRSVVRTDKIEP
jgi:hypothetical protein